MRTRKSILRLAVLLFVAGAWFASVVIAEAHDCSSAGDCEQTGGYNGAIATAGGLIAIGTALVGSSLLGGGQGGTGGGLGGSMGGSLPGGPPGGVTEAPPDPGSPGGPPEPSPVSPTPPEFPPSESPPDMPPSDQLPGDVPESEPPDQPDEPTPDDLPPEEPSVEEPPSEEPPPSDEPPSEEPPSEEPPAEEPPAEEPPAEEPPAEEPPAEEPPAEEPPAEEPPADAPPAEAPPADALPAVPPGGVPPPLVTETRVLGGPEATQTLIDKGVPTITVGGTTYVMPPANWPPGVQGGGFETVPVVDPATGAVVNVIPPGGAAIITEWTHPADPPTPTWIEGPNPAQQLGNMGFNTTNVGGTTVVEAPNNLPRGATGGAWTTTTVHDPATGRDITAIDTSKPVWVEGWPPPTIHVQQQNDTCAIASSRMIINRATGNDVPEPALVGQSQAQPGGYHNPIPPPPPGTPAFGTSTQGVVDLLNTNGVPAVNPPAATLSDMSNAINRGDQVTISIRPAPNLNHRVVVTDVTVDNAGNRVIHYDDPWQANGHRQMTETQWNASGNTGRTVITLTRTP